MIDNKKNLQEPFPVDQMNITLAKTKVGTKKNQKFEIICL